MEVKVISPTIQEFNGERFYLCGNYFQHKGKRLHVAVWRYHNGEIPKGYHVHHIDKNRANNQIGNLQLELGRIHLSEHGKAPERSEYNQKHIEDMRVLAAQWHGSDAGREWHSEHAKEAWEKRREGEEFEYVCSECGKQFKTYHLYGEGRHAFCSNTCKSNFRRKSGVDNETRVCAKCGKEFTTNRYSKAKCCSKQCASDMRWGK